MGLALCSRDVAAFTAIQQVLLSPLEYKNVEDWCVAVLRQFEALFKADRSAFLLPLADRMYHVTESVELKYLAAYRQRIAEIRPGAFRYSEQVLELAHHIRRARGIEAWSIDGVGRLIRQRLDQTAVYNEAVKPAGIAHSVALSTSLPAGETYLGVAHSKPADDPFGEEAGVELMGMLLPAFKAGVHTIVQLHNRPASFVAILDVLGQALLLCDLSGHELHQSRRLAELLPAGADRDRVLCEMRSLAGALVRLRACPSDAPPTLTGQKEIRTRTARYQARGSYVGSDISGFGEGVLVTLERLTPALPSSTQLIERYGLTRREAEIAGLLALGLSNTEIAARLSMSPHTVRHHAEWLFTKLGMHSRKALALRLMADVG
jgi:DNA-binding CsgD family transcriptional regulator